MLSLDYVIDIPTTHRICRLHRILYQSSYFYTFYFHIVCNDGLSPKAVLFVKSFNLNDIYIQKGACKKCYYFK